MGDKTSKPDDLVDTGSQGPIELSDNDTDQVSGGKMKTADKAFKAMDKYIRG